MQIVNIENQKQEWNDFVAESAMGSFLQTWDWAEFRAEQNNKIYRLAVIEDEAWLGVMFFYKIDMKLGQSILYAPRGPVLKNNLSPEKQFDVLDSLIEEINKIAWQEKVMSFEFDPYIENEKWCQMLADLDFQKSQEDTQPRHTLILDIRQDEEETLKQMHQKTRYNIRLAEKKEVKIEVDNTKFKEFWDLQKKTEDRQGISTFSAQYYENILQLPFVKLYLAKYEDKIIAANIMIFWGQTVIYLFGASDYEYRNIMAPYLLQWQAVKDAKAQGKWFYDFWGAAPKEAKGRETNWTGFTRFKMGFSPNAEITEYIGTYEKLYLPVRLGLYRYLQKIYKK